MYSGILKNTRIYYFMKDKKELIEFLKAQGTLKSPSIIAAFEVVGRQNFVPEEMKAAAYADEALPIGFGQTISQPTTVAFMLEHLAPQEGDIIFDVVSGSGWQATLLAHIVGEKGKVYTAEIVPELCEFGSENIKKYPELASRIISECGNASAGVKALAQQESLDKIIAAASLDEVPSVWRAQLKVGGKMIYPSHESLIEETKVGAEEFKKVEYPGFVFVPFVN